MLHKRAIVPLLSSCSQAQRQRRSRCVASILLLRAAVLVRKRSQYLVQVIGRQHIFHLQQHMQLLCVALVVCFLLSSIEILLVETLPHTYI